MLRPTGYSVQGKRPPNYPEALLARSTLLLLLVSWSPGLLASWLLAPGLLASWCILLFLIEVEREWLSLAVKSATTRLMPSMQLLGLLLDWTGRRAWS